MSWRDPVAGFEYEPATIAIGRDFQREKISACGLDPAVFGDAVDPSFFIGEAIHAGIRSGISAEGNVNMLQRLIQYRPALLDEPLTVRGRIVAVTDVPRGRAVDTEVIFEAGGEPVFAANRRSLKPDPASSGQRGAGERPPPVIADAGVLKPVSQHTLTPEVVTAYSREGNSIHYDLAAARKAGFRAPLIGGGMGVHFLLTYLWSAFMPTELDLDIYFRRPIFWDDSFFVGVTPDQDAIAIVKGDKVATEARINRIG